MNKLKVFRTVILGALFLSLVLFIGGCKNFGIPDYKITVIFEEAGIQGTPAEGESVYTDLEKVDYEYSAIDEKYSVEVYVNYEPWNPSGTLTMYSNISIMVRFFDVRGVWEIRLKDPNQITLETFKMTIIGDDMVSGTFTDDRGESGTWEKDGDYYVLTYADWEGYILGGKNQVSSAYTVILSGGWEGAGQFGFFEAVRIE